MYMIAFFDTANINLWFISMNLCTVFLSALEKKREENCRSEAVKKFFCLTTNGRSLDALSATQSIFSFLSTAAAFFVYFFLLKKKSKSLSGLRTIEKVLPENNVFICSLFLIDINCQNTTVLLCFIYPTNKSFKKVTV